MSQTQTLLNMLQAGRPVSNFEIHERTGMLQYPVRIFELKQKLAPQGYTIVGWHDKINRQKYWYQLKKIEKEVQLSFV